MWDNTKYLSIKLVYWFWSRLDAYRWKEILPVVTERHIPPTVLSLLIWLANLRVSNDNVLLQYLRELSCNSAKEKNNRFSRCFSDRESYLGFQMTYICHEGVSINVSSLFITSAIPLCFPSLVSQSFCCSRELSAYSCSNERSACHVQFKQSTDSCRSFSFHQFHLHLQPSPSLVRFLFSALWLAFFLFFLFLRLISKVGLGGLNG